MRNRLVPTTKVNDLDLCLEVV